MELFIHYLFMPYLLEGIRITVYVTAIGIAGGAVLGAALSLLQLSRVRLVSLCAKVYVGIFRGTPLILQMVFAYDAMPRIGIRLPGVVAAGVALAANEAPFIAEMIRSAIASVGAGQRLAGKTLGLSAWQRARRIVWPQAFRAALPAAGNAVISALKNSALAMVIAVPELTLRSTQLASSTFDFFSIFFAAGVWYLVLTGVVSLVQVALESLFGYDRPRAGTSRGAVIQGKAPAIGVGMMAQGTDRDAAQAIVAGRVTESRLEYADPRDKVPEYCVEAMNLRKSYHGKDVLSDVTLRLRTGTTTVLLGASGAGKSTLLRCFGLLETPDAGEMRIGNRRFQFGAGSAAHYDDKRLTTERLAGGVTVILQNFELFPHMTAVENVTLALTATYGVGRRDAEEVARATLESLGLSMHADKYPRHLSGGQQQRVAIARALVIKPRLLLMDEPTSALDPESVNGILELVGELKKKGDISIIITTHQLKVASRLGDTVVFMNNGQIVEYGSATDVLTEATDPKTIRFVEAFG
ncbi:ABC transporter permease subunit [Acidiferrobacter thiooxydans]|uniref:amino acid ABC transporter permease/ATP-binding protein n=1 Tax=Acidiferrobacter thiooxydans TaxID=163359 RepID=UPI000824C0AD|nr:ABC transporter permease subunit [Acidiferrobacter thiooxydans]UEN99032.1 ABC transporter permease subunit [Acidiferrobacter thiooxydans]